MMKQHKLLILCILAHATKSEQNSAVDGGFDSSPHSRVTLGLNRHLHMLERDMAAECDQQARLRARRMEEESVMASLTTPTSEEHGETPPPKRQRGVSFPPEPVHGGHSNSESLDIESPWQLDCVQADGSVLALHSVRQTSVMPSGPTLPPPPPAPLIAVRPRVVDVRLIPPPPPPAPPAFTARSQGVRGAYVS